MMHFSGYQKNHGLLCTNDRELRRKAREKNINVIFLRQRKYLDVDGHLNP